MSSPSAFCHAPFFYQSTPVHLYALVKVTESITMWAFSPKNQGLAKLSTLSAFFLHQSSRLVQTWPLSSKVNGCWFYLTRLSIQKFQPPKPIHWTQLFMGHLTLGGLGERQGPKIGSDPDHVAVTNREIWPLLTPTTPNDDWLWKVVMICDHFSLVRVVKWSCNNF